MPAPESQPVWTGLPFTFAVSCTRQCGRQTSSPSERPKATDGAISSLPHNIAVFWTEGAREDNCFPCSPGICCIVCWQTLLLKTHTIKPRAVKHLYASINVANHKNSSLVQHPAFWGKSLAILADTKHSYVRYTKMLPFCTLKERIKRCFHLILTKSIGRYIIFLK